MVAVYRSLLDPQALAELVGETYRVPVERCTLIRSFVNDVYEVSGQRRYVLKVYRHGFWSRDEVAWECGLARHLAEAGVPVARPVGAPGEVAAPEGGRPFALWEYVRGVPPTAEPATYREFGRLTAAFHAAADTYRTSLPRRAFDLDHTVDRPLAEVLPLLAADDADLVRRAVEWARRDIVEYADALDWGVCHGDVTLDNIQRTEAGLVLHDLDLAGPHWRAADLYGVAATPCWNAFAAGYQQVRPLGEADLSAVPAFRIVGSLTNLRFHLVQKPLLRGTESIAEGWVDDLLRQFATVRPARRSR